MVKALKAMPDILLATINARYIHTSFGLRYLFANLGILQTRCQLAEFENAQPAHEIAEVVIKSGACIVGFGVYIWNAVRTQEVVSILRKVRPEIVVVIGGPEVSYEYEGQELVQISDYLITGEADLAFAKLCGELLSGDRPVEKVIHAGLPALDSVNLPYSLYT